MRRASHPSSCSAQGSHLQPPSPSDSSLYLVTSPFLRQKPAIAFPVLSQPGLAWKERSPRKQFPKGEVPEVKGTWAWEGPTAGDLAQHPTSLPWPQVPVCGRLSLGSAHNEKLPDVLQPIPVLTEINSTYVS